MLPVSGLFLSLLLCLGGNNLCLEVSLFLACDYVCLGAGPRMGVVSVTTTVCHGGRSPILFHPIPVFHHPVSSRFSLHGIYPFSLLFLPDIFSSPMWTDLTHVRDPYLRSLADKLPDVVLGATADNTTLTYLNGLRDGVLGPPSFPRLLCCRGNLLCCLVFVYCPSSVHFSIPGSVSLLQHPFGARWC